MPLRRANSQVLTWRPKGCSDAADAAHAFEGAMTALVNLIPAQSMDRAWQCRPAAVQLTAFGSFTTPGFISALLVVGDIAYGMIASGRNAGKDEPFAYNIATNTFLTVAGIASTNVPTSPATSGDWTPPIMAQVASRIIVCHPGFPGSGTNFGWFDISGASISLPNSTTNGTTNVITTSPPLGVQPGLLITGTDIPANTTITNLILAGLTVANCDVILQDATHAAVYAQTTGQFTNVTVGIGVSAPGIPSGATVSYLYSTSAVQITWGSGTLGTGAGYVTTILFATPNTLVLSAAATGSHSGLTMTVTGGSATVPLWGAGDTAFNSLGSIIPVAVGQLFSRAYYCLGVNGIMYSDAGFPCNVSNLIKTQVLLTGDGLPATAIAPVPLQTPLTGGMAASLILFEDDARMQQITGDDTFNNLAMQALSANIGTRSQLSLAPGQLGLTFMSDEGMRIIPSTAIATTPVGDHGTGITVPFISAVNPSRICSASNADDVYFAVKNGAAQGSPVQDWRFDLTRQVWHGPHTFPASQIQPWRNTFVIVASGINAKLWQIDPTPGSSPSYTENGTPLTWTFTTTRFPELGDGYERLLVEMTVAMMLPTGINALITIADEAGNSLGSVTVAPSPAGTYRQYPIGFTTPIVFKQATVSVTGNSATGVLIGAIYARIQTLGYQMQALPGQSI